MTTATMCAGGTAQYVSGHKKRHWWRCPTCNWVGWLTTTADRPPTIGDHSA